MELLIYGTAESASTIMAVSIPMLRALLRTPKTKSVPLRFEDKGQISSQSPSRQHLKGGLDSEDEGADQKSENRVSICTTNLGR